MGFFSWNTADTNESIPNKHSDRDVKPVYLLQPNGKPAIKEACYDGYGRFGGVDVYAWLAEANFGDATLVNAAISADCGHYFSDSANIYLCGMHISAEEFRRVMPDCTKSIVTFEHYESPLPNGKTPNLCIAEGLWSREQIALKYPLKFSFNPDAVYEDLPASTSCK